MTRAEQRLLGPVIKAVIGACPDSWNRLKYEIFNYGNQSFYPAQSDFYPHVDRLMDRFDEPTRVALVEAWLAAKPRRRNLSDGEILMAYRAMIIESIVQRAAAAAYRSNELEL
jgi:hypothetical protein